MQRACTHCTASSLVPRPFIKCMNGSIYIHSLKLRHTAWKPVKMAKGPVTVEASAVNCPWSLLCELDHHASNHQPTQCSMISCKMIIVWCRSMKSKVFAKWMQLFGKWFPFPWAFRASCAKLMKHYLWIHSLCHDDKNSKNCTIVHMPVDNNQSCHCESFKNMITAKKE